jgi:hypothetical protein
LVLNADAILAGSTEAAAEVEHAPVVTLWRDEDPDGQGGPFEPLFCAFDQAEIIVGYNSLGFDHPVLEKHYSSRRRLEKHLLKVHDPFARLRDVTGAWYKLDHLLAANGLETKTANGLEAIRMWEDGERDRLRDYCEQDTRALARLLALPEMTLPRSRTMAANYVFGLASALAAARESASLQQSHEPSVPLSEPNASPSAISVDFSRAADNEDFGRKRQKTNHGESEESAGGSELPQ